MKIRNKVVLLTEDKPEEQTPSGTEIESNKDEKNEKKNKKTRSQKKSRKSRKKSKPISAVATSDKKEGKPVELQDKSDVQDSKVEHNFEWLLCYH